MEPQPQPSPHAPGAAPERTGYGLFAWLLALLLPLAALAFKLAMVGLVGTRAPFLPFALAVLLAAWYGGLGPGLGATAFSALLAHLFFLSPDDPWSLSDAEAWQQAIFLGQGVVMAFFASRIAHTRTRLDAAYRRLAAELERRALAEAALREREERLETLFRVSLVGQTEVDPETHRFLTANPRLCEITGYTEEELTHLTFDDITFPADRGIDNEAFGRMVRGETPEHVVEKRYVRKDGTLRWVEVRARLVRDADGRPLRTIGVIADVTDRRRALADLDERRRDFEVLADAIPQLAWMTGPDGYIYWYNRRWYEYTGTTFDEMEGWGWQKVHHPDYVDAVIALFRQHIETGEAWEDTFPLRGADGRYRWFLSRALPLRDDEGRILRWFGTNTDITDRLEMEAALRRSEKRFRQLADAMPQLVWTALPDGTVDYYNERRHEFAGIHDVEAGQRYEWAPVLHPDDVAPTIEAWERAVRTGTLYQAEHRVARADGQYHWYLSRGTPVFDADGRVVRWFGTATDIDDQKRTEEALREREAELHRLNETLEARVAERTRALDAAVAQLETANQRLAEANVGLGARNTALEEFAHVASHDLQEPLRKIRAFAQILHDEYGPRLDDEGRRYLDRVSDAAARMARLVQDLLTYSRLAHREPSFARVDLAAVVGGVVDDLDRRLADTGGRVDVGPLPKIEADALQMQQLFQNLVGNALKFHRPGVPPVVRVWAEDTPEGAVRLVVEDNGIGFEPRYREQIFAPFQRLHGRGQYEGTGVGLAICRRIAERHGGHIEATSIPGEGSRFLVTLPRRPAV